MIAGVILAAGKGSRFKAKNQNKVTVDFHGQSPIQRAVESMLGVVDKVFVVVGHEASSIKEQLHGLDVIYVTQSKQKGTGHAFSIALNEFRPSEYDTVIVGNGDHMMFYTSEILSDLVAQHLAKHADATCISSTHPHVSEFGFGRITRSAQGNFLGIVEQKDATMEQLDIEEFNSGLAIFNTQFAQQAVGKLRDHNAAQELYVTDLFSIGIKQGNKIQAIPVPFQYVGIGINSRSDYEQALEMFEEIGKKSGKKETS